MVYFSSGRLSLPGAMFTASHNPPQYNGLKLCRPGAAPVGEESGLREVQAIAESESSSMPSGPPLAAERIEHRDMVEPYLAHLLTFADVERMAPLTVVADAA